MPETTKPSAAEAQEIEATEEYVTADLCETTLRVTPVSRWRPSYLRALRSADFDDWAGRALHPDDVEQFIDLDATFDEINAFVADAMDAAGETPGKSNGPARSSRSTRKR